MRRLTDYRGSIRIVLNHVGPAVLGKDIPVRQQEQVVALPDRLRPLHLHVRPDARQRRAGLRGDDPPPRPAGLLDHRRGGCRSHELAVEVVNALHCGRGEGTAVGGLDSVRGYGLQLPSRISGTA